VLGEGIRLVVDEVSTIHPERREVALASGDTLGYDYLIYAVGSRGAVPTVPGASAFAHRVDELEHAQRLRATLDDLPAGAPVTVVGAGPTGLETASELAEAGRPVTLVCDVLGPYLSTPGRRSAARTLARLGVTVIAGTSVTAVREDGVVLADGRAVPGAVTVWTAGFATPDLATRSGLSTDAAGRLLTDETLTSVDDPYIVAAGDAAAPSGQPLRMSCQAALPLGIRAAETVLSRLAGDEPAALGVRFVGQCVSLGRRGGTIQISRPDDSPLPLFVAGRAAAGIKEAVCRSTVSALVRAARRPGSAFGLKGGRQRRIAVPIS
jgi:NADH:ubiquinone reductase (H+-translocating)